MTIFDEIEVAQTENQRKMTRLASLGEKEIIADYKKTEKTGVFFETLNTFP
jgi:hypothetical protein